MIKIAFFGTPNFSLPFLKYIFEDNSIEVSAVISQPDRKVGRKQTIESPPVANFAKENNIPLFQPEDASNDIQLINHLKSLNLDYLVIIAYGQIISKEVINCAKSGCINVHPSKLPKYRGPSPIQASLLNSDRESAVTIMLIDEKMDHGPILLQENFEIKPHYNYFDIENTVFKIGPELLIKAIKGHYAGEIDPKEQDHTKATYCRLIRKSDGEVNLASETATEIYNKFRAYSSWPGVYTKLQINGKDEVVKLLEIEPSAENSKEPFEITKDAIKIGAKSGSILIHKLQISGKKPQLASDLVKGIRSLKLI